MQLLVVVQTSIACINVQEVASISAPIKAKCVSWPEIRALK
jgi:hypothetical protein